MPVIMDYGPSKKLLKVDGPSTTFFSLIKVPTNLQNNKNPYFQTCNTFLNSAVWPPDYIATAGRPASVP